MNRLPRIWVLAVVMVCLLCLVAPALAAEAKGKIKTVTPDKNEFVMTDVNNKDWTFMAANGCKVFIDNKEGKLADLQAGHQVTITYDRDGDKLLAKEIRASKAE